MISLDLLSCTFDPNRGSAAAACENSRESLSCVYSREPPYIDNIESTTRTARQHLLSRRDLCHRSVRRWSLLLCKRVANEGPSSAQRRADKRAMRSARTIGARALCIFSGLCKPCGWQQPTSSRRDLRTPQTSRTREISYYADHEQQSATPTTTTKVRRAAPMHFYVRLSR